MKQKRAILLLGLIIILSGWWITQGNSSAQPEMGALDVWATWVELATKFAGDLGNLIIP